MKENIPSTSLTSKIYLCVLSEILHGLMKENIPPTLLTSKKPFKSKF